MPNFIIRSNTKFAEAEECRIIRYYSALATIRCISIYVTYFARRSQYYQAMQHNAIAIVEILSQWQCMYAGAGSRVPDLLDSLWLVHR